MKFKMAMVIAAISTSAIAETTVSEKEYNLPQCSKPIASVMVGNISCKSAACQQTAADTGRGNALMAMAQMASGQSESTFPAIGDGLKAMLTTALKETGWLIYTRPKENRRSTEDSETHLANKVSSRQYPYQKSHFIYSLIQAGIGCIPKPSMY